MNQISPAKVLAEVSAALPGSCRANVVVIGSLAAGYHFFKDDPSKAVRTKDVDCVLAPFHAAVGAGQAIKDIDKHRSDVFRLAATLPEEPGPELPEPIPTDLAKFLRAFPEDSPEWPKILASLAPIFGNGLRPPVLRAAIASFFHLPPSI
jgi:hypothetical protein